MSLSDEVRPQILFLTTDLPFPLDSGGRIKTFRLIEHLSKHADIKLICAYGGSRQKDVKAFREKLPLNGFQAFRSHRSRSFLSVLRAFLFAPTLNAYRVESNEITSMLRWSARDCDHIIVDHLESHHLLPEDFKRKVVYHSHNAEFKLWSEFAKTASGLKRWMLLWEANRVKQFERWAISRSRFTFAAPNDQVAIQESIGFKDDAFRPTYHLGQDALLDLPDIDLTKNDERLFYAGTLDWEPNKDGMIWFLNEVWPKVLAKHPACVLDICGRSSDQGLISRLKNTKNVNYLGFVEDLEPIMKMARAAIVPLRFGSGMKLKSFDALYRGLPLITTPTGAEGIALENKRHAYVVSSSNLFAEAISESLNDVHEATTIRNNGRELCRVEYTNEKLFNGMVSTILQDPS